MFTHFPSCLSGLLSRSIGTLAALAVAFCWTDLPGQPPEPSYIGVSILYYDLEGKGGYYYPGPEEGDALLQGSYLEIYRQGSVVPNYVRENTVGAYIQLEGPILGSFTCRCVVPAVGVFEGLGRFENSTYKIRNANYSLPVTSEAVGRPLKLRSVIIPRPELSDDVKLGISPTVTNDHDFAGAVFGTEGLLSSDRICTITVEYLPGNTAEAVGSSVVVYQGWDCRPLNLYWGTYQPDENDPGVNRTTLSEGAPEGPVRLTFFLDGYETDSVETTLSNHTAYTWLPLLRPRPDRPDVPRPDPSLYRFERVPISREVRRGILDDNARTHVLMDDNLDGVIDIADLVQARGSE